MSLPPDPKEFMARFSFTGKSAIVTGGGTGIGQATTWALLAAGAKTVLITGRRLEKLEQTARAAADRGFQNAVRCCDADMTQPEGRARISAMAQDLEALDLLVNNAGAFVYQALATSDDQSLDDIFAINVKAPFALMRDLLPLLETSQGSIVNISSTLAEKPIANTSIYNGAKAAIIQMTRSLALELGPAGVRVNAVLPAVVATPMYRDRFDSELAYKETMETMAKEHPLGRVGSPDDIAQAILFLASPAASWITGAALPVDGGMLCT